MPKDDTSYEDMSWTSYIWSIRPAVLRIEATLFLLTIFIYAANQFVNNSVYTNFYIFPPLLQFYALARIVEIKYSGSRRQVYGGS